MHRPPGRLNVGFATRAPDGHAFHPEVEKAMRETTHLLADLGHRVAPYDWQGFNAEFAWTTYTSVGAVLTAQLFKSFASEVGAPVGPDDVEPITWAMIERGCRCSGMQHAEDVQSLRLIGRDLVTELLPFDLYLTPTLTHPPRPHGYMDMSMTDYDAYNALMADACFLYPFNISGQPAMSLPMHVTADGLPVGIQFVTRMNSEATLLRVAAQLEEARPWIGRKPSICA
jgi:amidase